MYIYLILFNLRLVKVLKGILDILKLIWLIEGDYYYYYLQSYVKNFE